MRILLALGFAFGAACAALGQADPVETRRFTVDALTRRPGDFPGVSLALFYDAIGSSGRDVADGLIDGDDLADLVRAEVAPGTWRPPATSVAYTDGALVAVHHRSVLDAVAAWLARTRARNERPIVVDAQLVVVPFERWGRVEPRELATGAVVLKSARLALEPGCRVHAQDLKQVSYVRDHDVQISSAAAALDPSVDVLNTGNLIDLVAWPSPAGDALILELAVDAALFEALEDKKLKLTKMEPAGTPPPPAQEGAVAPVALIAKDWEALVQLPRTTLDRVRGQIRAKPGETVVAAAMSRADGVLALLLTPTIAVAPAVEGPKTAHVRFYDVGAILTKTQDWAGPRVDLVSPSRGGGGPLTGATYTLEAPREGYGEARLQDELRPLVGETDVEYSNSGVLKIRGTPEQHAAVEKKLREIFEQEVRTLISEAAIFSFKPGARTELAKSVPALAPGGTRSTDAELAPLFEEARKAGPVRLAGFVAVSGRPRQRVYAHSGRQQAYVQDFEPQVSSWAACFDPIIGVQLSGLGLDVRPTPRADDGSVNLDLHAWALAVEMSDEKQVSTGGGPVQRPKTSGFLWRREAVCLPGRWTLAALESRDGEEVALFVRVR